MRSKKPLVERTQAPIGHMRSQTLIGALLPGSRMVCNPNNPKLKRKLATARWRPAVSGFL